ncbi:serine hydrolase [Mameliella alba]|nr:serine hydrolase [Mameliella alba]MCA0956776.1 serine hydrolase [Mameliella alba]
MELASRLRTVRNLCLGAASFLAISVTTELHAAETAEQALLTDIAQMYQLLLDYQVEPPAGILVAVMGDASYIGTVGEGPDGEAPAEDGIFRIGSISKVLTGQVMAAMIAEGKIRAEDPVTDYLPDLPNASLNGKPLRLIDLAGQAAGLPRDLPVTPKPGETVDMAKTLPAIQDWMSGNALMFEPGSRLFYSNFGYQILGAALGAANGTTYGEALAQYVTGPLGMPDTANTVAPEAMDRVIPAFFFDESELPMVDGSDLVGASGGIFTTALDIETWLRWNLAQDADPVRDIFHTPHANREAYASVSLMDESGPLDAMGLGWVFMKGTDYTPFTIQKAGAHAGYMAYVAMAPERQAAVFMGINQYEFTKDIAMTELVNSMLASLPGAMD